MNDSVQIQEVGALKGLSIPFDRVRLAESIGLSAQKTKQEVRPQSRASHPFFARENRSVQTVLKRLFGIGLIRKNEKTAASLFLMSDSAGSWLITIAKRAPARWDQERLRCAEQAEVTGFKSTLKSALESDGPIRGPAESQVSDQNKKLASWAIPATWMCGE
jgi:hypothetical protein